MRKILAALSVRAAAESRKILCRSAGSELNGWPSLKLERSMPAARHKKIDTQSATQYSPGLLLVSLELSRSNWLVSSLISGGDKLSKHSVSGGNSGALLDLLTRLKASAEEHTGKPVRIITIQEAGFDGFWLHRLLERNGIESHVVDPASVAVPRRHRRAKTDAIDGETLIRTLLAWKRGEPRVCTMVVPPAPDDEDRRRISRERETLVQERIRHSNRIKGLLAGQGITDYQPLRRACREALEALRTGDGRPLPSQLKAEVLRELERIELVQRQIVAVEAERDALIVTNAQTATPDSPQALLFRLRAIGPELATLLSLECLFRRFDNRRQVAAFAGLAPTPWQSGKTDHEQGISKSGSRRVRTAMIELAWLWLRYQPDSALSRWFLNRVGAERGRRRRIAIVAMARKLLIALWRYVTAGVVPEGAVFKAALTES